uniref:Uncharacterized protein n=1 Tax=Lactuca sativa TaxID=4236 RepID=A0A9R1X736_LACSA|nr:hypothetical protein LSAT_V11C700375320 [Lactuca sativa]
MGSKILIRICAPELCIPELSFGTYILNCLINHAKLQHLHAQLQHLQLCATMFRQSCFGDMLTCRWELLFLVHEYRVCVNMKAFCLITYLRFEDYFPPVLILHNSNNIMANLMHVFNDLLHEFGNADAARVSLLYMLKQRFLGKCLRQLVTNNRLAIVSNLDECNKVIWDFTYTQLCTVFDKIEEHLNPTEARVDNRHTYTVQGFVYVFKVFRLCFIIVFKKKQVL